MSQGDADYWHRSIQPDATTLGGPDAGWDWPGMRRWLPVVEFARGRRAPAFTVWAQAQDGQAVPIAMTLLSEGYAALHDAAKRSVYLWFMAAAPEEAMRRHGLPIVPRLGRVLVDIAVTHSHNCGYGGCIGLHAAPAGGQKLFDMYRNVGLSLLSGSAALPGYLRNNDGRYFYLDELQAQKWSNSLNSYR